MEKKMKIVYAITIRTLLWWLTILCLYHSQNTSFALVEKRRSFSLGLDFGTSGVRACLLEKCGADHSHDDQTIVHFESLSWDSQEDRSNPTAWIHALPRLLHRWPKSVREEIDSVSVSGTSATALLYDYKTKEVTRSPCMYDYSILQQAGSKDQSEQVMALLRGRDASVASPTSTLAKLLSWHFQHSLLPSERLAHQADWITWNLLGKEGDCSSDWHNSLKLGFDVEKLEYGSWMKDLFHQIDLPWTVLPHVSKPGTRLGKVHGLLADQLGLSSTRCEVVAGTTDSIAAFLAAELTQPGQAVTSLGSTLVIKLLSKTRVEDVSRGIYSHRLGDLWLVGGASSAGCAIFRHLDFSNEELVQRSREIDPMTACSLDYYPLIKPGERFPVNDPYKLPKLEPQPHDRTELLRGLFHGLARIEADGYAALEQLGASPLEEVFTAGGGAKNEVWQEIRSRTLGKPVSQARHMDSAYGSALLAFNAIHQE
eukprot:scaffold654_cov207-Ochromonas_danica.AAC.44